RGQRVGLLAGGAPGTQLLRVERAALARLADVAELAPLVAAVVERWLDRLSSSLVHELRPREFELLEAGRAHQLSDGAAAGRTAGVLWIRQEEGRSHYLGRTELAAVSHADVVPLSAHTWLQATGRVRLSALDTGAVLAGSAAWAYLDRFHALALACLA